MKTITMHRILILACIFFHIGDLNAVPADYEAVYTVKLLQADGTLRAKLENNDGTYTYTLKTEPTGFWKLIAKGSINESSEFEIIDEKKHMNWLEYQGRWMGLFANNKFSHVKTVSNSIAI